MRRALILLAAVATAAAGSTAAAASAGAKSTRSPQQTVRAYLDAFNRGDADATAALFSTDAVLTTQLGGCSPCVGRGVIRDHFARAIANQTHVTLSHIRVKGSVVTGDGTAVSPQFPTGIGRVIGLARITVRNGLIVRFSDQLDRRDPQTAALLNLINQLMSTPSTAGR